MEERVGVRQIQGESKRRWFASDDFDLIVWLSDDERLIAFELCYDKRGKERSIRWSNNSGYLHMAVDDGEQVLGKHKETPILIADGLFDSKQVHSNFQRLDICSQMKLPNMF